MDLKSLVADGELIGRVGADPDGVDLSGTYAEVDGDGDLALDGVKLTEAAFPDTLARDAEVLAKYRHALDAGETTVTVVNVTTTQFLIDYTMPGGTLAAGDRLYIEAAGDILNESGGAVNYSFRQYIGTTIALTGQNISVANAATNRYKWVYRAMISQDGTGAQRVDGTVTVSTSSGFSMVANLAHQTGYGTAAEDLSSAKRIGLAIILGTASPSADIRMHHYTVERLGNP